MNKDIKYIVEGLLDDITNDVNDEQNNIYSGFNEVVLKETVEIIKKIILHSNSSLSYYKFQIDTVNYDFNNGILNYYYIDMDGEKRIITVLTIVKNTSQCIEFFQEMLDLLLDCDNLKYIKLNIVINKETYGYPRTYDELKNDKVIDFHNLLFYRLNLVEVNASNISIDDSYRSDEDVYEYGTSSWMFKHCIINNFEVKLVKYLELVNLYNIKDYSFIHNVVNQLYLSVSPTTMPYSNSLKGLPNGQYSLILAYKYNYNIETGTVFSLEGLPNTLSNIEIRTKKEILQYFSFKGITESIVKNNKFIFEATGFVGKRYPYIIQLGPYKIEFSGRVWKPTKPQLLGIIKANDWFLDCYIKAGYPNKEYIPSSETDQVQLEKIQQKEKQKQDIKEQKKQDDIEDTQLKINRIKKFIQVGDIFNRREEGYSSFEILEMGEKNIKYKQFYKTQKAFTKLWTYEKFLKDFVDPYSIYINQKGESLYDLIIKPVEKRRARILKKRKEDLKIAKALQKEQAKQKLKSKTDTQKQEIDIKQQTPKLNIEIVDYSEKALALFGATYQIKDKLKELGAYYNPRLKYKTGVKPGWIISKKQKEQIEQLINGDN